MSGFTGMDVDAVRSLSNLLNSSGGQITEMVGKVTSQLGSTQWVGNDRQAFEGDWNGQHSTAMKNISAALEQFASVAEKNAAEQEATSQA